MSKNSLIALAVTFGIVGAGGWFASQRVICMTMLTNECMFITSGSNLFDAKGTTINSGVASAIQTAPFIGFGLGGIFLLTGLLKSENA